MKITPFFLIAACGLANSQPASSNQWNLQADIKLVSRCTMAARMVMDATETYPSNEETRDRFIQGVLQNLRKTNAWGESTPGDVEMMFAKSALGASKEKLNTPQGKQNALAQTVGLCTLHSSRTEVKTN